LSADRPDAPVSRLQALREQEGRLEEEVRRTGEELSGLRDIDRVLALAAARLSLSRQLLGTPSAENAAEAREKALAALRLVDGLLSENISEDQKGIIQESRGYAEVRALLQEFLLAGGGGLLESRQADARARRILSRTIVGSVRKYAGVDDRYVPLILEQYPPFIRRLLLLLFPVMVREKPEPPPYGIEEGEEITYSSPAMKMPLSQAVFYMEHELLPELEKKLAASPGDAGLQEEIRRVTERMEYYRKLRFFPRSTPVLLEKGYYTDGMTGYTADGEMLVPIPMAVSFRSGTNLDRMMELVRMDVVRRIAGRGVSAEIDQEYRRLRSLESGIRGSSRAASMKLDAATGYRVLRQEFPFLVRLADKRRFVELVSEIQKGRGSAERRVEALIEAEQGPGTPGSGKMLET
jgi:hypothetical protein